MFVELMPLLAGRTVLITVAKMEDETMPRCYAKQSEIAGITLVGSALSKRET